MSCLVSQEVHLLGHQQLVQFSTTFFILSCFQHTFYLLCNKFSRLATSRAELLTGVCQSAPYLLPRNKHACLIQKTGCFQPLERCFSCLHHGTICVLWLPSAATKPEPRVRPESTDRAFQAGFSFCSKRAPLLVAILVLRFRAARSMPTDPVSARGRWSFPFRRPCSLAVSLRLS